MSNVPYDSYCSDYIIMKGICSAAFLKEGVGGIMEDDIANFFKCYTCYDCIPKSAKLGNYRLSIPSCPKSRNLCVPQRLYF